MILVDVRARHDRKAFPRTRGGDPGVVCVLLLPPLLFPAHAGVILDGTNYDLPDKAFPRTRGGDFPCASSRKALDWRFSI